VYKQLNETHAAWIFFVSYLAGVLLTASMTMSGSRYQEDSGLFLLYVAAGQIGLNVLPAFLWCRYKQLPFKAAFNLHKVSPRILLLSFCLYAVSQVILLFFHQVTELVSIAAHASYETSHYPVADSIGTLLVLIVSIGILAPICEELLFRGALLSGFLRGGPWFTASITAALFAIFHDNPYRLLELFAAAWISAIIVLRSGSIYTSILIHLLTNITFVSVSFIQGADMMEGLSAQEGPQFKMVMLTGIASVLSFFVCRWLWVRMGAEEVAGSNKGSEGRVRIRAVWMLPIVLSAIVFIVKYLIMS
jgi:membrane protease YdiL (CAAX protease family)